MDGNRHQGPERSRAGLGHPIIDADGHRLESGPVPSEQLLAETPSGVGR
jgi:hypothetical protein